MGSLATRAVAGMAAGAAGATALNAASYLDMVLRGRAASEMPAKTVEAIAHRAGVPIPGEGESRRNRLSALGALTGIGTGAAVGALGGILAGKTRLPLPVTSVLLGVAAMAGSDVPMTALGLTNPKSWSATSWASDLIPHLAYGVVTAGVARALTGPQG